jgi:hypothetical protein
MLQFTNFYRIYDAGLVKLKIDSVKLNLTVAWKNEKNHKPKFI